MSTVSNASPDIAIEFAPNADYLVFVRQLVNCLAETLGLDDVEKAQLEMCVDEACANSIQGVTGNGHAGENHKVRVEAVLCKDCVRFTVHDFGGDYSHYFNKACPMCDESDRTKTRGYGLQIIKTLMDEVSYIHDPAQGNKLHITKYISRQST